MLDFEISDYKKRLAVQGVRMLCQDPDLEKLSADQINHLHICKHEILVAIHRLYIEVQAETADKILKKYFNEILSTT